MVESHHLPKLPELKNEQGLQQWTSMLQLTLRTQKLEKYIKGSVPDNQANAIEEKAVVMLTIEAVISTEIHNRVINGGYDTNNKDPFIYYEAIQRRDHHESGESASNL